MIKKFEHEVFETCNICKKQIETDEELWCSVIDYSGDKQTGLNFYHQQCLKDIIKGNLKIVEDKWKAQAGKMMKGIMGNLKRSEVVEV